MKRAAVTIPGDIASALEAYLADQRPTPPLTAVVHEALAALLAERGYLPGTAAGGGVHDSAQAPRPRCAGRFASDLTEGAHLLNPSPEDYRQALARLEGHRDLPLSLFDGVVAVLAERLGVPVWTYDQHFHAVGASVWQSDQG